MSQLDDLSEAIKNLSGQDKRDAAEQKESFRDAASKNETEMYDISKDLASYFATQEEESEKIVSEIEESTVETENVGRRVDDTNTLLRDSINIQNQMLSEIGNVNQSIEKLITDFPIWIREASLNNTGAGGLAGLAEVLGAGGLAEILSNRSAKGTKSSAVESATTEGGVAAAEAENAAAAASVASKKPSVLGSIGRKAFNIGSGHTGGGIASGAEALAEKPSVLGKLAGLAGKALRVIPFLGDAYQGIERGYESGSIGEGFAAAGGSLAGRLTGGFAGTAVAGPIGGVVGEVAGSTYGAQAAADAYHKTFNNSSKDDSSTTTPTNLNKENSTPTAPAVMPPQIIPEPRSGSYIDHGRTYTNIPQNVLSQTRPYADAPEVWQPKQSEIITGTGIIPNVGYRSSQTLEGSPGPGSMDSYLHSYGGNSSAEEGQISGGSAGGRRSEGDNEYHGSSGKATTSKGSLAKNQQIMYDSLRKSGMSDSAAKIAVGNASGESLRNPADVHADPSRRNPNQKAHGIASWDDSRAARIAREFPEAHGQMPQDLPADVQARAYAWEMKKYYPKVWADLNNEKLTPEQRMYSVVKGFESPANAQGETQKRLGLYRGLNVKENGTNGDGSSVEDNIKGLPAGTPPEITNRLRQMKASGQVNGDQCVALAQAAVRDNTNVHDWRKGESADSGKLVPGTPIATFLNRKGEQTDRYAGGGSGTPGAHLDHAAVFEKYITDKEGHNIGMQVGEQYVGSHGVREKNYMFHQGWGEGNASNYNAIKTVHGGYLGGERNPMSPHEEASAKPQTRISRPAPPAPEHHKENLQTAKNEESHSGSGGHYGSSGGVSSRGSDKIRSASVGPAWGDVVKSVTGSYGIA